MWHVWETGIAHWALLGRPDRKRALETPILRLGNNIEMDFQELGCGGGVCDCSNKHSFSTKFWVIF
jgi:hypothetical protein